LEILQSARQANILSGFHEIVKGFEMPWGPRIPRAGKFKPEVFRLHPSQAGRKGGSDGECSCDIPNLRPAKSLAQATARMVWKFPCRTIYGSDCNAIASFGKLQYTKPKLGVKLRFVLMPPDFLFLRLDSIVLEKFF
jgi:hypothetical protein